MQTGIPVKLPGGLIVDGMRVRDAVLRPLDGLLEEQISAAMACGENLPSAVSEVLGSALLSIGGETVTPEQVDSLTMADRQWLMLNLAYALRGGGCWLKGYCDDCGQPFDLYLDYRQLPMKTAGEGFPFAELDVDGDRLRLRLPDGADQKRIAGLDAGEAIALLLSACLLSVNDGPVPANFVDSLDAGALSKIEDALDGVSPYVGTTLAAECPECKQPQRMEINPYLPDAAGHETLFQEVHILARAYHWSERDILSMSRDRRRRYMGLIEREMNIVS